jgi:tRNA pseudouridine55 synthase
MLPNLESVYLDEQQNIDIRFGRSITCNGPCPLGTVKLFNNQKQFLGIGIATEDGVVAPKRLFV